MNTIVRIEQDRRVLIARCRGELDLATRPALESGLGALAGCDVDAIVVDLARVTFMDCSALNVLVALARDCRRTQVALLLTGATAVVRRLLSALDLERVFTVLDNDGDAVASTRRWLDEERPRPAAAPVLTGTVLLLPRPRPGTVTRQDEC